MGAYYACEGRGNARGPAAVRLKRAMYTAFMDTMPGNPEEWRAKLTPEQYRVLREKGTEAPFSGALLKEKREGTFNCAACRNSLFSSETKFDSGTGWPSFEEALPGAIEYVEDVSHGMRRTEVVCARCKSHLGHVFNDGPLPSGKRFCMNSICLGFEEKKT